MVLSGNYDIKDAALAEAGKLRIEWAYREMPVMRLIRSRFTFLSLSYPYLIFTRACREPDNRTKKYKTNDQYLQKAKYGPINKKIFNIL